MEFLHFLADQLQAETYDVLLPTHEQVYLLSRFRDVVGQTVGLALPEFSAMQRMQDKAQFTRMLDELGLPHPDTAYANTVAQLRGDWRYPCYLKLAHSTAGAGVFYLENQEQLEQRIAAIEQAGLLAGADEALIQQPARGQQASVQAVFDRGRMVGVHSFDARQLGVGGMSSARVSADHPVVREHIAQLGAHLDWHGAMFVDYFYDHDTGQPEYIECNPRVGETVSAWLAGVNLCEQLVRVSRGDPVESLELGTPGVRTQSFMMILITMAYNGASRRSLLKEWARYRFGRDIYADSQDELTRPGDDLLSVLPLWWVTLQLVAVPSLAQRIVAGTIANYSLPASAVAAIEALDPNAFRHMFEPPSGPA